MSVLNVESSVEMLRRRFVRLACPIGFASLVLGCIPVTGLLALVFMLLALTGMLWAMLMGIGYHLTVAELEVTGPAVEPLGETVPVMGARGAYGLTEGRLAA